MSKIGVDQGKVFLEGDKIVTDEQGIDCCCEPVEVEEACCLPDFGGCILATPADCVQIHGGTVPGQPTCEPDPCGLPCDVLCSNVLTATSNFMIQTAPAVFIFCANDMVVPITRSGGCVWSGTLNPACPPASGAVNITIEFDFGLNQWKAIVSFPVSGVSFRGTYLKARSTCPNGTYTHDSSVCGACPPWILLDTGNVVVQ